MTRGTRGAGRAGAAGVVERLGPGGPMPDAPVPEGGVPDAPVPEGRVPDAPVPDRPVPPAAPTADAPPALDVRGLSVTFDGDRRRAPTRVLDGVDLRVAAGEFVALLGPSGCGKSTLLRVLAGLPPAGARVRHDALMLPSRRTDGTPAVAWMPQRDGLLPWRRALANATLGAAVAGRDPRAARARAAELFEVFGLAGFERAWPHELSGGMRQRLALLRTCLAGADVLLLDEPFGALDPITRRRMNAWLADLDLAGIDRATADAPGVAPSGPVPASVDLSGAGAARPGPARRATVVLVTHDVDEAVLLADRVVVLGPRPAGVVLDVPTRGRDPEDLRRTLVSVLDDATSGGAVTAG
jgi:ABC-type nitrate/sulfonate/bicarbonate transport system ATPase subunit